MEKLFKFIRNTKNIKKITDYISSGIKEIYGKNIGVECEHIITTEDKQPVSFYGESGINAVLEELAEFYPQKTF